MGRLGEGALAIFAIEQVQGLHAINVGSIGQGSALVKDDPDGSYSYASDGTSGTVLPIDASPTALPWAVSFWVQSPPAPDDYSWIIVPYANTESPTIGQAGYLSAYVIGAGTVALPNCLRVVVGDVTGPQVISSVPIFDDKPHHVQIRAEAGQPLKIYVDGLDVSTFQSGTSPTMPPQVWAIGAGSKTSLTVDEFLIWQGTIPTTSQFLNQWSAGLIGWPVHRPYQRMNAVLDSIGWPAADRDFSTGGDYIQPGGAIGQALDYLLLVGDTDAGLFFPSADGKLTYRTRAEGIANVNVQAVFGDGPGEIGYQEPGYEFGDDLIRNVIRRTPKDGGEIVVSDAASMAEYMPKDDSTTGTLDTNPVQAWYLANWRLDHTKDPKSYVPGLVIDPRKDPATYFPVVLGRELGDRVEVIRRPQGVGSPIDQEVLVEGIDHDFGPKRWKTTFKVDPTGARKYARFDFATFDNADSRFAA